MSKSRVPYETPSSRGPQIRLQTKHPLALQERANLQAGVAALADEVPSPAAVRIIVTDTFDRTVAEYVSRAPSMSGMPTRGYTATKPDGAQAIAKTVEVPGGKVAVIASRFLLGSDPEACLRTFLHEAQHVRVEQDGGRTWAAHREIGLKVPDGLTWEFIWLAEAAIDEFRCERELYERGLPSSDPARATNYQPLVDLAAETISGYQLSGDLTATYHTAFALLDRLSTMVAYAAAACVVHPEQLVLWADVPPIAPSAEILRAIPPAGEPTGAAEHVPASIQLARVYRSTFNNLGFDYRYTAGGSGYFEILR
jgi:hypothetical protein